MKSASIAAATFAFTLLAIACTTTTTTSEPTTNDKDAGQRRGQGRRRRPTRTGDDDDEEPAKACGDEADQGACVQLLRQREPGRRHRYFITRSTTCLCKADKCATECADNVLRGNGREPRRGVACNTCLTAKEAAATRTSAMRAAEPGLHQVQLVRRHLSQ